MKQILKIKEGQQETENVFCNKCLVSCNGTNNSINGLIEAEIIGGYDSTHLADCDVYVFSLCERCLVELFSTFKYPARQGNLTHPDNYMPGFDRRKYLNPNIKLWIDLTDEERAMWHTELEKDPTLDYMKEVPRDELIVWLYDAEQEDEPNADIIAAIKKTLQERK